MFMPSRDMGEFPPPMIEKTCHTGMLPSDFVLERFLEIGLEWFRATPEAAEKVFSFMKLPILEGKYGQEKIDEIRDFVKNTEIDIMQSFPIEDREYPCVSINLQSSGETGNTGLDDFAGQTIGTEGVALQGFTPVKDEMILGIHSTGSPDKTKYLYYLITYILNAFKDQLEDLEGSANSPFSISWRASDISRLNDYLPSHVFTRFLTVSFESFAIFDKELVPNIEAFEVFATPDEGLDQGE